MLIRIGFDITFEIPSPTTILLMLYTHPSRAASLLEPELIFSDPFVPITGFTDVFGNHCGRVVAPAGNFRIWHEAIVRDTGLLDPVSVGACQHDVADLPVDVLPFLMGSRYCETDRLSDTAWKLFGHLPLGWARVQGVCDWVHKNVKFGYEFARPTKTAYEVFTERQGVCRDFTHLLNTFLRCLNIPARYATGYLGDIGVPPDPAPMDFSAWSEVYLDNRWFTFDGRHNASRIGRVVMARGRDATDVAITTSFGPTTLKKFIVKTDEVTSAASIVGVAGAGAAGVA